MPIRILARKTLYLRQMTGLGSCGLSVLGAVTPSHSALLPNWYLMSHQPCSDSDIKAVDNEGGCFVGQALNGTGMIHESFGVPVEISGQARLERLEAQVQRILARLDSTRSEVLPARPAEPLSAPISFDAGRAKLARAKLRERRQREQFLPADIFADPAWDMLLDLYAAHYERREVSVSSLCIAANVPATTALRWIKSMTDHGMFERTCDPHDGRRILIAIGESTRLAMDAYFDKLSE